MEFAASKATSVDEACVKSEPCTEGLCIKSEPSWDDTCVQAEPSCLDACVKSEPSSSDVCVKDEPSSEAEGARGVSEAAAAALYADHVVKDELIVGPTLVQPRRELCAEAEPQRMPAPNTINRNGPAVYMYKRKRLPNSDCDDAEFLAEWIIIGSNRNTDPVKRAIAGSPVGFSVKKIVVGSSRPVTVTSQPGQPLTTAIKEKRFMNMVEMFPEISPLFIKDTLVKHAWSEERSRDELLKHDPETNEKAPAHPGAPLESRTTQQQQASSSNKQASSEQIRWTRLESRRKSRRLEEK